jgi:hypothetical protein
MRVLPLYPPPKGEPCPNEISIELELLLAFLSVGYSRKKIFDFFDSPFGGGQGGGFLWNNINSCLSELFEMIKEISRFKSPHELNKFIFLQLFFNASSTWGRIQPIFNTAKRF